MLPLLHLDLCHGIRHIFKLQPELGMQFFIAVAPGALGPRANNRMRQLFMSATGA